MEQFKVTPVRFPEPSNEAVPSVIELPETAPVEVIVPQPRVPKLSTFKVEVSII